MTKTITKNVFRTIGNTSERIHQPNHRAYLIPLHSVAEHEMTEIGMYIEHHIRRVAIYGRRRWHHNRRRYGRIIVITIGWRTIVRLWLVINIGITVMMMVMVPVMIVMTVMPPACFRR